LVKGVGANKLSNNLFRPLVKTQRIETLGFTRPWELEAWESPFGCCLSNLLGEVRIEIVEAARRHRFTITPDRRLIDFE
jgi:hypothetical protein